MTDLHVAPAISVEGELELPGDKSVSHRALLMALLGTEPVRIYGLAPGDDVMATLDAVEALGARVERHAADDVTITGRGMDFLPEGTSVTVDARNSGTLARLLAGLACAQRGTVTITGDASLSSRPMGRIVNPLREMGGAIQATPQSTLPLTVGGHETGVLNAISYVLPMASAQVQSAILFAGLYADGVTRVSEPAAVRDHTERILKRAGALVARKGRTVTIEPCKRLDSIGTRIPADPSSAAPFILAATVLHGSLLRLPRVLSAEGRNGFIDVIERMGGNIAITNRRLIDGEQVADLEVQHALNLNRVGFDHIDVPRTIDELPLLGLAFHFCKGASAVRGAGELRAKESDRIVTLVRALRACGVAAEERKDGFAIHGSGSRPDGGGLVDAAGDHRIAMLGGIGGVVSRRGVDIEDASCVDVSYPGFFDVLDAISVRDRSTH
jgi:3-phosphoshikimate 1-carboxyvinyltransferase